MRGNKIKKFGGKDYTLSFVENSVVSLRRKAAIARKKGYFARVVVRKYSPRKKIGFLYLRRK